jgi:signal transduction histidine kinase
MSAPMSAAGSSVMKKTDLARPDWLAFVQQTGPCLWLVWWPHEPGLFEAAADFIVSFDDQPVADQLTAHFCHDAGLRMLVAGLEAEGLDFHHLVRDSTGQQWVLRGLSPSGRQPRLHQQPCLLWCQKKQITLENNARLASNHDHPILDHLSTGVVLFDRHLMITDGNRAWWRLIGMSRPDRLPIPLAVVLMESRDRHVLAPSADFTRFQQDMADWLGRADETPLDLHLANGQTQRWIAYGRHGNGPMLLVEDITQQMEMTRSLAAMGAVQRQSLDHLRDGIMVIGADGRLRYHNAVFLSLMGGDVSQYGAGDLLSRWLEQLQDLLEPSDQNAFDWLLAPPPQQGLWRLKNGRILDGQSVRLPDGACLVCLTDVTAREQATHILRLEAHHQADINRIKSDLWASLACRLRTPLTSIVGYSEALEAGYFGVLASSKAAAFENILLASRDLQSIVERMVDVAALQAGLERLDCQPIDLFALLHQVAEDVRLWSQHRQRFLRLDLSPGIAMVLGDVKRLNAMFFDIFTDFLERLTNKNFLIATGQIDADFIQITIPITQLHGGFDHGIAQSLLMLHQGKIDQTQDGEWMIFLPRYHG